MLCARPSGAACRRGILNTMRAARANFMVALFPDGERIVVQVLYRINWWTFVNATRVSILCIYPSALSLYLSPLHAAPRQIKKTLNRFPLNSFPAGTGAGQIRVFALAGHCVRSGRSQAPSFAWRHCETPEHGMEVKYPTALS
jgi:hypothetical protein